MVARFVRDEEAVGSNPATPTVSRRDRLVPATFVIPCRTASRRAAGGTGRRCCKGAGLRGARRAAGCSAGRVPVLRACSAGRVPGRGVPGRGAHGRRTERRLK